MLDGQAAGCIIVFLNLLQALAIIGQQQVGVVRSIGEFFRQIVLGIQNHVFGHVFDGGRVGSGADKKRNRVQRLIHGGEGDQKRDGFGRKRQQL